MLLTTVLASALFICSTAGKTCFSLWGVRDVSYLIQKLQDNCTTPCFQEGLSQLTNNTAYSEFRLNFNRVKKTVEDLQRKNCQTFSCEQPCNQTTTGNTLTFLKRLLHAFQKESNRGTV
ncbi:interleukin-9 [Trichechus inunguis]